MLVKDIVSRVRNIAGDINALQFSNSMLVDWINDGIKEIAVSNALCQKSASQSCVEGQDEYDLPGDIFKLFSVYVDGTKVPVVSRQQWEDLSADSSLSEPALRSKPTAAYIWATKLMLHPVPDTEYGIKINYIYEPVDIPASEAEVGGTMSPIIPTSYHLRLVTYCLAQIAMQDEDFDKYQNLIAQFETGVIDLKHQGESEEDLYPFIHVSARDMGSGYDLGFDY